MKVNFDQELKDFHGEPLRGGDMRQLIEQNGQINSVFVQGKILTLKAICVDTVSAKYQDEQLSVEQHIERFMLAQKIQSSNHDGLDLKSEEIALIEQLLTKTSFTPLVVGQVCQMLEGGK